MKPKANDDLYIELNRNQPESEISQATLYRYHQFFKYIRNRRGKIFVLDVGCNTGRGGQILRDLNKDFFLAGVDCLAERLNKTASIYNVVYQCASVPYPLNNASCDCILAGEFIEHLTREDAAATLGEFFRLLKPQGQVMLTTPNPGYLKLRILNQTVIGGPHLSEYMPNDLGQILLDVGFKKVTIRGSGRVEHYIGDFWPFLDIYGSYLVVAEK